MKHLRLGVHRDWLLLGAVMLAMFASIAGSTVLAVALVVAACAVNALAWWKSRHHAR